MFSFSGRMKRLRFFINAAGRVVLFAATLFGFPYILWAIAAVTKCSSVSGACGAVALTVSMALKPLFFFLFVASLVGISLRRARDAGLPAAIGLAIPLLALADYSFGVYAGAHWSFAFATGAGPFRFPWFLISSLIAMAVLSVLPSRDTTGMASNNDGDGDALSKTGLPSCPGWILLLGALMATGAVLASQSDWTVGMMVLVSQIMQAWFPTFVMYSAVLWGMWCVAQRRDRAAIAVLAVALVPFGFWLYATISVTISRDQEAQAIRGIKTESLPHIPNVLVVQSTRTSEIFSLHGIHGIKEVIADGPHSQQSGMVSYTGQKVRGGISGLPKTTVLPPEYLLLKVGRQSSFALKTRPYTADGGPLELRYVVPGRDDLVAIWYKTYISQPSFPPALTVNGWLSSANSAKSDDVTRNIKTFVDRSISQAAARAAAPLTGSNAVALKDQPTINR